MSPYAQISNNVKKTWLIMIIFVIIFSGFFYLIGQVLNSPWLYLLIGLTISILSAVGSYFFSDKIVLTLMRARLADKKEFFDFYTTTENLCLAAGLPMPKLYVIDDPAPNAFATGRDPKHAVVCATTGLLRMLDRSDIEGVVAHELSHIKNYDILLATIISVIVGTISIVADIALKSFFWGNRSNQERRSPLLMVIFFLSLVLIPLAATLIQLAISRKREFLADASAVLLTRNPEGLADALEKISRYQSSRFIPSSFAHLFIVNPLNSKKALSWLANLFSTHPPIEERIKILRGM